MGVHGWKKIVAIFVLIAFIGIGLTWAMEQGTPQFQEKAGTPVVKKHKKFPWLIAILGVAAVGVGIYFLTKKKDDDSNLDSTLEGTLKETFSGSNLFGGRQITPLDLKWGKFNYRHRKPGEKIYIVSGNDACEDRIL